MVMEGRDGLAFVGRRSLDPLRRGSGHASTVLRVSGPTAWGWATTRDCPYGDGTLHRGMDSGSGAGMAKGVEKGDQPVAPVGDEKEKFELGEMQE